MKLFYQEQSLKSGIYKIINTHSNRIYIGQAKEFKSRWKGHSASLLADKHQNKFLLSDFNKCKQELGHDDFLEFHVLEVMEGSTKEQRNKREEFYIAAVYDQQDLCYNFKQKTEAKERSCYSKTPEETREKHRISALANEKIKATQFKAGQTSPMKGKSSDPSSKRISERWKYNEKFKKKMSELGKLAMKKLNNSKETLEKRIQGRYITALKKYHGQLVSPEGVTYDIYHVKDFAQSQNLSPDGIRQVLKGSRKHHKGWTKSSLY